jgi:hypothetical protein
MTTILAWIAILTGTRWTGRMALRLAFGISPFPLFLLLYYHSFSTLFYRHFSARGRAFARGGGDVTASGWRHMICLSLVSLARSAFQWFQSYLTFSPSPFTHLLSLALDFNKHLDLWSLSIRPLHRSCRHKASNPLRERTMVIPILFIYRAIIYKLPSLNYSYYFINTTWFDVFIAYFMIVVRRENTCFSAERVLVRDLG